MSTFVLVHGAWHGGWCWYKVVSLLRQKGHTVLAPDLPAHGRDQTPINAVSMQSYAQRVADVMRTVNEPVILVGHSMGGFVISAAAEQQPQTVAKLVYLAAFLLEDGQTFGDAASRDGGSTVSSGLVPSADGASLTVAPDRLKDIFYGDCSDADVALAATGARSRVGRRARRADARNRATLGSDSARIHRMHQRPRRVDRIAARDGRAVAVRKGDHAGNRSLAVLLDARATGGTSGVAVVAATRRNYQFRNSTFAARKTAGAKAGRRNELRRDQVAPSATCSSCRWFSSPGCCHASLPSRNSAKFGMLRTL